MGEKGVETATAGSAMPGRSTAEQGAYTGVTGGFGQPIGAPATSDASIIGPEASTQSIIGPDNMAPDPAMSDASVITPEVAPALHKPI
jgi:hypothetical protein